MRVLVLGAGGQVGRALAQTLPRIGEVTPLGRAEADLGVPGRLAAIIAEARPDFVVNAAAYTAVDKAESEPDLAERINAAAPAELAAACADTGATLIHYSTDYVFDGRKTAPYEETDDPGPLNVYGASKLRGESKRTSASAAKRSTTSWPSRKRKTSSCSMRSTWMAN